MNTFHLKKLKQIDTDKWFRTFPQVNVELQKIEPKSYANLQDEVWLKLAGIRNQLDLCVTHDEKRQIFHRFFAEARLLLEDSVACYLLRWALGDVKYLQKFTRKQLEEMLSTDKETGTKTVITTIFEDLFERQELELANIDRLVTEIKGSANSNIETSNDFGNLMLQNLLKSESIEQMGIRSGYFTVFVHLVYQAFLFTKRIYTLLEENPKSDTNELFGEDITFFKEVEKELSKHPTLLDKMEKWVKLKGSYLQNGYFIYESDFTTKDVRNFLLFLYEQKSHLNNKPFLSKDEVEELIEIGFKVPQNGKVSKKYNLNVGEKEIGRITGCFHRFWDRTKIDNKNIGVDFWCAYLITYFDYFKDKNLAQMKNNFRTKSKQEIGFDIELYLPKKQE